MQGSRDRRSDKVCDTVMELFRFWDRLNNIILLTKSDDIRSNSNHFYLLPK
jgi:hypothetical protein